LIGDPAISVEGGVGGTPKGLPELTVPDSSHDSSHDSSRDACKRWEDDLALLAGGDLSSREREVEALAHVESCGSCAALLADLGGDQAALVDLRAASDRSGSAECGVIAESGVVDAVLAVLARPARPPSRRANAGRTLRTAVWAAAATLALVATVASMRTAQRTSQRTSHERAVRGIEQTLQAPGHPADRESMLASTGETLPVQVRRVAGDAVELSWSGDGREGRSVGAPYRVMASASPGDFEGAWAHDVAGNRLVATASLPAARMGDRAVTYFRVQ
jgi:hypothetical protein